MIELLLALDSSASMDRDEFALQVKGIAAAFRDPLILKAVEDLKPHGVAIGVSQWGSAGEARMIIPFVHIESARDAQAFGFRVSLVGRFYRAAATSIATAISSGVIELERNAFDGQRRVIDVSGDGVDNGGEDLETERQSARAAGIVVNGLAIEAEDKALAEYYKDNVIIGADSFVVEADDFNDFARAIREKLLRELRPLGS